MTRNITNHQLHQQCEDENCNVCRGGLALCEVCGGTEASLPTMCPGRKMTPDEADSVQAAHLDFNNGKWISEEP